MVVTKSWAIALSESCLVCGVHPKYIGHCDHPSKEGWKCAFPSNMNMKSHTTCRAFFENGSDQQPLVDPHPPQHHLLLMPGLQQIMATNGMLDIRYRYAIDTLCLGLLNYQY